MATVIDALLVTLGLDASGMKKGQKDASDSLKQTREDADRTAKEMQARGKQAGEFYKKIRNEVAGLLAIALGGRGLMQFTKEMTATDAAAGRLASNIGMSTDQLTAWENAAKTIGGSAEATGGSLKGLTMSFQQLALTGQSAVVPYFRAMGMAIVDAKGKLRPLNDILLELSDRFSHMNPATAQSIGASLGLDEATINLLMKGRKEVERTLAEQRKNGLLSKEDAAAAETRQKAFKDLGNTVDDLGRKLLTTATPAIIAISDALQSLSEWAKDHQEETLVALGALATMAAGFSAVAFVSGVYSMTAAIVGMTAALSPLLTALGVLGVAVGAYTIARSAIDDHDAKLAKGRDWNALEASLRMQHPDYSDDDIQAMIDEEKKKAATAPSEAPQGLAVNPQGNAQPRGIRNNNPGNLEYRGQPGAVPESGPGRFARFSSMSDGVSALAGQLQLYGQRGIDTVRAIIGKYAPSNENNTESYINSVAKSLGVSADAHLMIQDPKILRGLIQGISTMENGAGKLTLDQINAGLAMRDGAMTNNNTHAETHVGTINIQTQAKDADGIARSIGSALERYGMAAQANYSLG